MKLHHRSTLLTLSTRRHNIRFFSSSTFTRLRSSELTNSHLSSLRANASRLWTDIHTTAEFGKGKVYGDHPEQTGLSRLALSQHDKFARQWFIDTTRRLGCEVKVDQVGNIFAVRSGLRNDLAPTFVGSHLDSQPNGGRFDGVLGVCAGVEMLRVLDENWIETESPVGVVNWTNEEGARWKKSMMGSGVWAGVAPLEKVWELKDEQGITVKVALRDIGALGDQSVSADERIKLGGHFELHIEQGKVLERNNEIIGVVGGVQAYKWFTVTVTGEEGHAGATAWEDRLDAMRLAVRIMEGAYKAAEATHGLVTIGTINIKGASINTIPGEVSFTIDARHPEEEKLERLVDGIKNVCTVVEKMLRAHGAHPPKVSIEEEFSSSAMRFDAAAMACIIEGARNVLGDGKEARTMISGAGHDSVNANLHCPTAMIFVRCKDGITHNPKEWCSKEDCKTGADVLIESVLRFDRNQYVQSKGFNSLSG